MIRRACCAIAVVAIWLLLLGWVAGLSWHTPLLPHQRNVLNASDFHVVMGAGVEDGSALHVGAVGDDGNALQSISLDSLSAQDFSLLRYRFDEFPRTLELSLVFRRADAPGDVVAITLPWPGSGWRSVDLRSIPDWRGDIIEIGFAEYATAQLVPANVAFQPFIFDKAELWSPSWRGGFETLSTSWFGYTPWSLLSVNALGRAIDAVQAPPLVPILVVGGGLTLFACALILRWSRPRLLRRCLLSAFAAWMLLDLRWLDDFQAKHQLVESLYAGKPWRERARLLPDQDNVAAAEMVKAYLAEQPPTSRILGASDSTHRLLRFVYLLLPLDIALLQEVAAKQSLPQGTLLLFYASTQWRYDAVRGTLSSGAQVYPVETVLDSGNVRLYRLRSAQP